MRDDLDLLPRRQRGEQVGRLVDDADEVAAQPRASPRGHGRGVDVAEQDASGVGRAQQARDGDERRLAGAGGAAESDGLTGPDAEVDLVEQDSPAGAVRNGDGDVLEVE